MWARITKIWIHHKFIRFWWRNSRFGSNRILYNFRFVKLYFDHYLDTLDAIGKLQTSSLELTVSTSSDNAKFIVGDWAEVKVTPTEVEFFSDFRWDIQQVVISMTQNVLNWIFSLAIKTCKVTNENDSKNLFLIEDFCETDESDPIIRKNPEGKFPKFSLAL